MTITTTIDEDNIRDWIGLKSSDAPSDSVIEKHITWSLIPIEYELDSTDSEHIDYAVLLKAGSRILKVIAQKAVKNGYIEFSGTGIDVKKGPGEILELAQQMEQDYNDFCSIMVNEASATSFLGKLNASTIQDVKDIYQGVNNVWNYQAAYHPSMGRQNQG